MQDFSAFDPFDDSAASAGTDHSQFDPLASEQHSAPESQFDPRFGISRRMSQASAPKDYRHVGDTEAGFAGGVKNMKAMWNGFLAATGEAVGNDDLKAYGLAGMESNEAEAQLYQQGRPTRVEDIDSVGSFIDYAQYTLGSLAPFALESALSAIAGAAIGSSAPGAGTVVGGAGGFVLKKQVKDALRNYAKKQVRDEAEELLAKQTLAKVGAATGAIVGGYPLHVGDAYDETIKAGSPNPGAAFGAAVPMAALDAVVPAGVAGRLMGQGAGSMASRAAKGAVADAGKEGLTELGQEEILLQMRGQLDPEFDTSGDEASSRRLNSFVAGALGGAATGGVSGAMSRGESAEKPEQDSDSTPDISQFDPLAEAEPAEQATVEEQRLGLRGVLQRRGMWNDGPVPPEPAPTGLKAILADKAGARRDARGRRIQGEIERSKIPFTPPGSTEATAPDPYQYDGAVDYTPEHGAPLPAGKPYEYQNDIEFSQQEGEQVTDELAQFDPIEAQTAEAVAAPAEPAAIAAPQPKPKPKKPAENRITSVPFSEEARAEYAKAAATGRLPEGLRDARLIRTQYRGELENMAKDLVKGGGVSYVRNDNDVITGRTASVNPDWFQSMSGDSELSMSTDGVKTAVDLALKGRRLGVRQARVVGAMLDTITGKREDYARILRSQRDAVRASAQEAQRLIDLEYGKLDPSKLTYSDADAGEVYAETDYPETAAYVDRVIAELAHEALQLGASAQEVDNLFDQSGPAAIIRGLKTIIQRAQHERPETTQEGNADAAQSGRNPADAEILEGKATDSPQAADQETLTSYTEADLAARDKAAKDAERKQAKADAEAEQRAQAQADAKDFTLTGSDRAADVAEARGQGDLLGAIKNEGSAAPGAKDEQQADRQEPAKWFGSREKAEAYLEKKKLTRTHEAVHLGKSRFEIRQKAETSATTEPQWWQGKTGAERSNILAGAGIKGNASTKWGDLTPAQQTALDEQWGVKKAKAPDVETRKATRKKKLVQLDDDINSLADQLAKELNKISMNPMANPEIYRLGVALGVKLVQKGALKFADFADNLLEIMRSRGVAGEIRDHIKPIYAAVRQSVDDDLFDRMDDDKTVRQFDLSTLDDEQDSKESLAEFFERNMSRVSNNNDVKKLLAEYHGKEVGDVTEHEIKAGQEAIELAVVLRARTRMELHPDRDDDRGTFNEFLREYQKQPLLNTRTSTSMQNQAYSTPIPLAFLSARLAGIDAETKTYEPTAGNGALLITADAGKVSANELNDERAAALRQQGFSVSQVDATQDGIVEPGTFDAMIANPPFGTLKDGEVKYQGYTIKKLDHLIAAKALESIKDNGRAVLIMGANKEPGVIGPGDRVFFNWLYSHYNVVDHFEVHGKLYNRQGAGWPVVVVTINGRQQSDKLAPPSGSIERIDDWSAIYEHTARVLDSDGFRPFDGATSSVEPEFSPAGNNAELSGQDGREDGVSGVEAEQGTRGGRGGKRGERPATNDRADGRNESGRDGGVAGEQRLADATAKPGGVSAIREAGADRAAAGEKAGRRNGSEKPNPDRNRSVSKQEKEHGSTYQVEYRSASGGPNDAVLVPVNMRQALEESQKELQAKVGDVDAYVMGKLGYESETELDDAFMGLQVDTVAAAIYNIEQKNKGIIIADQTGVGKGRQAAAILRYALRNDVIPVFVTVKPNLFSDMYNDALDIGETGLRPFIFNGDGGFVRDRATGGNLFESKPAEKKQAFSTMVRGDMPENANAVFMTYSQVTNAGSIQRKALGGLLRSGKKVVFVMDEAHNAAGQMETIKKVGGQKVKVLTGAGFWNAAIKDSPVVYLSATYAKRPDNMPIYYRTDLMDSVDNPTQLVDAVNAGGEALQTVIANMLARSGQLWRRERSFDGISIKTIVNRKDRKQHVRLSDEINQGLSMVVDADNAFSAWLEARGGAKHLLEKLGFAGASSSHHGGAIEQHADHSPFTSVIHNYVRQMLVALKADWIADEAIALHKQGKKPVIALESTMESFLKDAIEQGETRVGDAWDGDYRSILIKALNRTKAITVKDNKGDSQRVKVPDDLIDPSVRIAYKEAERFINGLDLADVPIMFIDHIRHKLEKAGLRVSEITGRNYRMDYSKPVPVVVKRDPAELTDRRGTVDRFNAGDLDCVILNAAGSTGLSIHASTKFSDQKTRHMLVAQPMLDINIMMQMLGRINRTGQVVLPEYSMMGLDLPAEKRPLAVANRKMRSLNANTSANTDSDTSLDAPDIMNKYGDKVVQDFLNENPDISRKLGIFVSEDGEPPSGLAMKFTGRLSLLDVKTQEKSYAQIEQAYSDLVEFLDSTGQNDLKTDLLDLDAKIISSEVIYEGKNPDTIFGGNATLHHVDVRRIGRPPAADDVLAEIEEVLDGKTPDEYAGDLSRPLLQEADEMIASTEQELERAGRALEKDPNSKAAIAKYDASAEALTALRARRHEFNVEVNARFLIGARVRLDVGDEVVSAIVTGVKSTHKKGVGSPVSGSKVRVTFATNSPIGHVSLPLSQLSVGKKNSAFVESLQRKAITKETLEDLFNAQTQSVSRERRYIATGNLISGFSKLGGGRVVNFTGANGKTYTGILMPRKYGTKGEDRAHSTAPLPARDPGAVKKYLEAIRGDGDLEKMGVFSQPQSSVRVIMDSKGMVVTIPKKADPFGDKLKFDADLHSLMGQEFAGRGGLMIATVKPGKEAATIAYINELVQLYVPNGGAPIYESAGGKGKSKAVMSFDDKAPDDALKMLRNDLGKASKGKGAGGMTVESVEAAIAKRVLSFKNNNLAVRVVPAADGLPDSARYLMEDRGDEVSPRGFYDPNENTVYMVASQLESADEAKAVLEHEAVGHLAVEMLLGSNFRPFIEKVMWLHKHGDKTVRQAARLVESEYGADWKKLDEIERGAEVVAKMAELRLQGSEFSKRARDLWTKIVQAVKRMLEAAGFDIAFSASDVDQVLMDAGNLLRSRKGKLPTGQRVGFSKADTGRFAKAAAGNEILTDVDSGAPIDRAFRKAFDLAGLVNEQGTFEAPQKTKALARAVGDAAGRFYDQKMPWAHHWVDIAKRGLIDRYGLDLAYLKEDDRRAGHERRLLLQAQTFLENLKIQGVDNHEEAKVLHAILTGKDVDRDDLKALAQPIREAIDAMGREAVELGLISEESYQRNAGSYLHRSYLKHEDQETGLSRWANHVGRSRRRKIVGNQLKRRGLTMKIDAAQLGDMRNADVVQVFQAENGRRRYEKAGSFPPAGWRDLGSFEVRRDGQGVIVGLWRDWTEEERQSMGEILDARYAIAKTYRLMAHDLAVGRFYKAIANNPEWSKDQLDEGDTEVVRTGRFGSVLDDGAWVKVPDVNIPKSGAKKWGALAGRYVRSEIWRDLNELEAMNRPSFWQKLMTQWKLNKTARNPVVHLNNVMSNLLFMDMADVRMRDLYAALKSMRDQDQDYKDALENGAFGSGFVDHELRRGKLDEILAEIKKQATNSKGFWESALPDRVQMLGKVMDGIWSGTEVKVGGKVRRIGVKPADEAMKDAYQMEDEMFRMATYLRRRALGDDTETAAHTAREQFLNYDIRAPWINLARQSVLPFIGYTYRAVPVIAKSLAERPWKVAKYVAVAEAINALGYALAPGDEDEERRALSEDQQGSTWLGVPRMLRMPFRDGYGDPVYLDIRRWIPAGDVFDTNVGQAAVPIPAPLQWSGPLMLAAELMLNKQAFTGKEIINEKTDDSLDKMQKVADWGWKSWMPSAIWIPNSWYWEKMEKAIQGGRDSAGRVYSVPLALSSSVGIKVQPLNVEQARYFQTKGFDQIERALKYELTATKRLRERGMLSLSQYQQEVWALRRKLNELAQERRRVLSGE